MATNYPGSLDSYSTHTNGEVIAPGHVNNVQDAIAALEAKAGVTTSAVTTSLDYLVSHPGSGVALTNGFMVSPRGIMTTTTTMSSGNMNMTGFIAPKTMTCGNLSVYVSAGGSSMTLYKLALFSLDASGNGTLLAATADQHTSVATGKTTFALTAPQAVTAGAPYAVAILGVGGTRPTFVASVSLAAAAMSTVSQPWLYALLSAQADIPASFTFASLSASATGFYQEVNT